MLVCEFGWAGVKLRAYVNLYFGQWGCVGESEHLLERGRWREKLRTLGHELWHIGASLGVFVALSVDAFTAPCSVIWRREECVKEKVAECVRGWQVCGRGIGEALLGEIGLDRSDLFV